MVLSLDTPTSSEFLKDWPASNASNCDKIDAYANSSLTSHSLKSFVPIWTATGGSNPTIGTGGPAVLRTFYYEIFDQIYMWGEMRFGTTAPSSGTGTWIMTLPASAKNIVGINIIIGTGTVWSNGTPLSRQPVQVFLRNLNQISFSVRMNSGAATREVTGNSPIAWAPQDGLTWNARFQRDPTL